MACRIAKLEDAVTGARLLLDFHKAAKMPFPASGAWAHNLFCECVTDPNRLALVTAGGILLAAVGPSILGPFVQADEIAWWVSPERRGVGASMLLRYEQWAISMGARLIGVASLAAMPEVESIYERRGFARLETHWVKVAK